MKVRLDRIKSDGLELDETLSEAWLQEALGLEQPFKPDGEGHLAVRLERMERVVHVRGRARVGLQTLCSRCLGPAHLLFDSEIELAMFPKGQEPPAGPKGELSEEDMGVSTYDNDEIDLAGVVRDEVILQLPMNPVCSEKCAGLCSGCGTNLNEGPCACSPEVDERWRGLLAIEAKQN